MTMTRVEVLMSTYNGARYLPEMLASVYGQEGVEVSLRVRDDGSTDGTCSLLEAENEAGRLRWSDGERLGPARSFMRLLRDADPEAGLYAFADQDDVWLPDKLLTAAEAIGDAQGPALYFCQTRLVDERLNPLPQIPIHPRLTFGEALVYQFVGGCTMVFNAELRRIVNLYEPEYLRMHDMWVYLVALAVGAKVVFDPVAHILYRQHGGNAVGQKASLISQWRERLSRIRKGEHIRLRTACELLRGYGEAMTPSNRALTEAVVSSRRSLRVRLSLLCSPRLTPANKTVNITSRLAILSGMF